MAFTFRELTIDAKKFADTLRNDPEKAVDILTDKFEEMRGAGGAAAHLASSSAALLANSSKP